MKRFNPKFKIFILILLISHFSLLVFQQVNAQSSPQFFVSWKADSYVPEWYQGKILPNRQTSIKVNFDLIDNGKIVDLSATKIRWYVDDKLRRNEKDGLGIKTLQFIPPWSIVTRDTVEARIVVVDYKGETIGKIINIPLVKPETVIQNFNFGGELDSGTHKFQVNPFFFNIRALNDLAFNWIVNGKLAIDDSIDEPSNILNLEIAPGLLANTNLKLEIGVEKLTDKSETARKKIELTIR